MPTKLILAFDVETPPGVASKPSCLDACRHIVPVLRQFDAPATMFIVAELLEDSSQRSGFQHLFDWDNIHVGSHSATHRPVRIHPLRPEQHTNCHHWCAEEIDNSKKRIEGVFGKLCLGFRSPWGFPDGLADVSVLTALDGAGYKWSSSRLWGPDCTMPAPYVAPYNYMEFGFPGIWEMPSQGWHENVLKGYSFKERSFAARLVWPSPFPPEAIPSRFIRYPQEEIAINKVFIDLAIAEGWSYYSPVWHPWSLLRFDPQMCMLWATIEYARDCGMELSTFQEEYERCLSLDDGVACPRQNQPSSFVPAALFRPDLVR